MSKRDSDEGRLGGGLISAAIGMSEFMSPLGAYLRITGEVRDDVEGDDIDRGTFLEDGLRKWAMKKLEAAGLEVPGTVYQPKVGKWASYTPDGVLYRPDAELLEIKSPGLFRSKYWGEPGTDEVPRETAIQGAWGLFVTGLNVCHFGALIDGKLKLFKYERDVEIEEMILSKAKYFMEKYVATKTPPPPTFASADTEFLKKRFPRATADAVSFQSLTPQAKKLVELYIGAYKTCDSAEKTCQEFENQVKAMLGDIGGIEFDDVDHAGFDLRGIKRIDWTNKAPAMNAGTWKSLAEELLGKFTPEEREALLQKHKPKMGVRAFTPYFKR